MNQWYVPRLLNSHFPSLIAIWFCTFHHQSKQNGLAKKLMLCSWRTQSMRLNLRGIMALSEQQMVAIFTFPYQTRKSLERSVRSLVWVIIITMAGYQIGWNLWSVQEQPRFFIVSDKVLSMGTKHILVKMSSETARSYIMTFPVKYLKSEIPLEIIILLFNVLHHACLLCILGNFINWLWLSECYT